MSDETPSSDGEVWAALFGAAFVSLSKEHPECSNNEIAYEARELADAALKALRHVDRKSPR